jgi:hypothetical protein
MNGMSLLDVLRGVMLDPAEQAAYNAGPGPYLQQHGFDDVDPADLSEAFGLVADTLPPDQAQAAWEAAAEPDDGSFGTVTADFDGIDAGAGNGTRAAADSAEAPDRPDAPDAQTLSFGEGEDGTTDLDDPTFGDDPSGLAAGLDVDDDAADVLEDGLGETVDVPEPGEGATTDELDDGIDDGLDDGIHDDLDDVGQIDGLGEIDDQGPDDIDIGSF